MSEPLLIQYRVLSDQRIHFSKLFWQSIAFLFALLLAGFGIFGDEHFAPMWLVLIVSGSITTLMGYTVGRLRQLEAKYEGLLRAIELSLQNDGHSDIKLAPLSAPRGARFIITLGLYGLGVVLILLGFAFWIDLHVLSAR